MLYRVCFFSYLPKCPVSFGWMFGPVDRLRVLLPSEISTEIRRRRWSLVSSFPGHKGYALRKATAVRGRLFVSFSFFSTCSSDCPSPLLGPYLFALVSFLLAFICRGRGRFFCFVPPCARTVQCWENRRLLLVNTGGVTQGRGGPLMPRWPARPVHCLPPEWGSSSGGTGLYSAPSPPRSLDTSCYSNNGRPIRRQPSRLTSHI